MAVCTRLSCHPRDCKMAASWACLMEQTGTSPLGKELQPPHLQLFTSLCQATLSWLHQGTCLYSSSMSTRAQAREALPWTLQALQSCSAFPWRAAGRGWFREMGRCRLHWAKPLPATLGSKHCQKSGSRNRWVPCHTEPSSSCF